MRTVTTASAIALLMTMATTGTPANAFETFPACNEAKVLGKIISRFNWAEQNTWKRGIDLQSITRTRERPSYAGEERTVERRYCRGQAHLSNGRHKNVHYLIERGAGFAGIGWNVEFCVGGNDRWRVYDGSCRVLRR